MFMYYFTDSLLPVRDALRKLMKNNERVIAAFDGRAASGKTTAAEWLAVQLDGEVIHMDDFFLPSELRTSDRLAQPGGNIHYERFAVEVMPGLKHGESFEYRRFDCSIMGYNGASTAGSKRLIIVEGAYSLHPNFGHYYDLAVFFHVDPDEQKRRIKARNGDVMLNDFTGRWIPMEERYIAEYEIESRCDLTVGRDEQ